MYKKIASHKRLSVQPSPVITQQYMVPLSPGIIKWLIFSKILTTDTPWLAHEGEPWGVFCEYNSAQLLQCCMRYRTMLHWIAIDCQTPLNGAQTGTLILKWIRMSYHIDTRLYSQDTP